VKNRTSRVLLALLAPFALLAAACGDDDDDAGSGGEDKGSIVVGSTDFPEQQIVASMYAQVLEDAGYDVTTRLTLGTRDVVEPALEEGEIDLYPEYVGTALTFLTKGEHPLDGEPEALVEALREEFEARGVTVLEPAPAEDKNALVVTKETAEQFDLTTTSDLADVAGELVLGGPPECPERPLCLIGFEETYGLQFREFKPLDAGGPLTKTALENGDIDVALLFSSDGGIAARDWLVLEDDKGLQPPENLVPVIRTEVVNDEITDLLDAVSEKLTTEELSELNRQVDVDKADPEDVARTWLEEQGLLGGTEED